MIIWTINLHFVLLTWVFTYIVTVSLVSGIHQETQLEQSRNQWILDWPESCRWEVDVGRQEWSDWNVRHAFLNIFHHELYQPRSKHCVFSSAPQYYWTFLLKVTVPFLSWTTSDTLDWNQWTVVTGMHGSAKRRLCLLHHLSETWEGYQIVVQWLALWVLCCRCGGQGISVQAFDLEVLAVNVSVNGCLSQYVSPVINRRLIQGVRCHLPNVSGDQLQPLRPVKENCFKDNEWMHFKCVCVSSTFIKMQRWHILR